MSAISAAAPAAPGASAAPPSNARRYHPRRRRSPSCGHGPLPLDLEFSISGERRGALQRLAAATGIDKSVLSRTFSGQSVPELPTIVLIAEALGVCEACVIRHPPIWHRVLQEMDGAQ